jgi:Matrixin
LIRKLSVASVALSLLLALPAAAFGRAEHATLIDLHITQARGAAGSTTANCSNDGSSNGLYALTGWTVQGNKTAHLNTATIPAGLGSVTTALQASFDAWKGAEANAPKITVANDGTLTRKAANHRYDLLFGRTGGSTIAVTYTWRWSTGEIESDTVFNSRLSWFLASSEGDGCYENQPYYELRDIATHEFGHTYGLGHPGADRFETMYAYGYTGETLKWSPANGDTAGIKSLY